jgi:SNF2 family DNA or RNA helicase
MDVIAPGSLGPKWKFNDQFQNVISVNRKVLIFSGLKNIEQLHEKIKGRVFGYDKLQLPPIAHVYKSVSMSPAQKAQHDDYYDNAQRLLAKSLSSGLSHSEKMLLQSLLLKARQACNALDLLTKQPERPSVKTQEILSDVKQLIADGHKIVLFSQWTEYLDLLHREFAKLGIGCVFFTGRETERQRAKSLDSFANNSKINVFLASDAGGVGVDGLQMSADVVIHTELPWNPARLDQRTGRVHRLGQSKPVQAFYYYASGTIEEKMLQVLQGKRDIRTLSLDVPKE